jgi:hypothetical protein
MISTTTTTSIAFGGGGNQHRRNGSSKSNNSSADGGNGKENKDFGTAMNAAASSSMLISMAQNISSSVLKLSTQTGQKKNKIAKKWTAPVVVEWLKILGLGKYSENAAQSGLNGKVLLQMDIDELVRDLGISRHRMHELSFRYALEDLRNVVVKDYDTWPWSCAGVCNWLRSRGLDSLCERFKESAVHGGLLFRFTKTDFIQELGVPTSLLFQSPGQDIVNKSQSAPPMARPVIVSQSALILVSLISAIERARKVGLGSRTHTRNGQGESIAVIPVADWSVQEVCAWLDTLHLHNLVPVFRFHAVHGAFLLMLTPQALEDGMGLNSIQSSVISSSISELRKRHHHESSVVIQALNKFRGNSKKATPGFLEESLKRASYGSTGMAREVRSHDQTRFENNDYDDNGDNDEMQLEDSETVNNELHELLEGSVIRMGRRSGQRIATAKALPSAPPISAGLFEEAQIVAVERQSKRRSHRKSSSPSGTNAGKNERTSCSSALRVSQDGTITSTTEVAIYDRDVQSGRFTRPPSTVPRKEQSSSSSTSNNNTTKRTQIVRDFSDTESDSSFSTN